MDDEERRIRERYRGRPEYFRKLQEYKIRHGLALPFARAKPLLERRRTSLIPPSGVGQPAATDFFRRLYEYQIEQGTALPYEVAQAQQDLGGGPDSRRNSRARRQSPPPAEAI